MSRTPLRAMTKPEMHPVRRTISARLLPNPDNWLLWLLGAVALLFVLARPLPVSAYMGLVDWRTLGALAGLLILTKGIERSGMLQRTASQPAGAGHRYCGAWPCCWRHFQPDSRRW